MMDWVDAAWLAEALAGTTLLMLLVLAVRRPVARLWGAHMAYALWLLPALRMALPAIPGWQPLLSPFGRSAPAAEAPAALFAPVPALAASPVPASLLPGAASEALPLSALLADWPALLLGLWAAGAMLFLAIQWSRHARFVGRAVREGRLLTRQGGVDVILSAHVPGPMAAGIVRRRVLLPADFQSRYSPAERRLALLHEGAHHDRGDLLANLLGLVVLAAHWWNPVAHAAWRAFRSDQELACDASVLAGSDGDTRAAYAGAVLKSACVATPVAACAMNHKSQLKERIAMMKDRKLGLSRRLLGALSIAGIAAGGLIATASGAQPAPPAPAAPPAPPAVAAPAVPPAPAAPRVMLFTHRIDKDEKGAKGAKGAKGEKTVVRTIVMKDGKLISEDLSGDGPGPKVMMFGADGKAGPGPGNVDVQVTNMPDGRRMVMVRRIEGPGPAGMIALDGKGPEGHIAAIKADMRARCEKEGVKVATNADLPELAMCGAEVDKRMAAAMAAARAAIEKTPGLSAEQRAEALKGIDHAMAGNRQNMVAILRK